MPNGRDGGTHSIRFEWLCLPARVMYGTSGHKGIPWPAVSTYLPILSVQFSTLRVAPKKTTKEGLRTSISDMSQSLAPLNLNQKHLVADYSLHESPYNLYGPRKTSSPAHYAENGIPC